MLLFSGKNKYKKVNASICFISYLCPKYLMIGSKNLIAGKKIKDNFYCLEILSEIKF